MYSNTTSMYPTHFLRGVELVKQAGEQYKVPSENWPYPTHYRYGIPVDNYYAEIWCNGMDWQPNYWVIEEANLEKPRIYPFIIFEDNEDRSRFNDYDFTMLVKGSLFYRQDLLYIKHNDLGVYTDLTWPYLHCIGKDQQFGVTQYFEFRHASQESVNFWMNIDFVPAYILDKEDAGVDDFDSNVIDMPVPGGGVRPVS